MSFNAFVKKNETIDVSFFLYADPKIDLFVHSETDEIIKNEIQRRNEFMRSMIKDLKEDQETPSGEKNPQDSTSGDEKSLDDKKETSENLTLKIDIEKIAEEQAKGNDSLEIKDGVVQIIFKEENLFEMKIKIKQPNHEEVSSMISSSTIVSPSDGTMKIDFNRYNDIRVRSLLKSWNLMKEKEGGGMEVVPVNDKNISALHPKVFNAILTYINLKIDMYLENLVY